MPEPISLESKEDGVNAPFAAGTSNSQDRDDSVDNDEVGKRSRTVAHRGVPTARDFDLDHFSFLQPAEEPGFLGWLVQYRVLKVIGQGGMGIVFLAEDPRLRRQVALKVMRPEFAQDDTARQRFLREARATAAIRSEHIVTIHEIGQADNLPYLASEFLLGKSMDVWLKEGHRATPAQVLRFGLHIARGLEAAHRAGLIHRDIKPANLWLEEPAERIKILDFGLVRDLQDEIQLTQAGGVLGTLGYMAPEQADGQMADARSDLFSLGCVLYELASGEKPFQGSTVAAVMKAAAQKEPPLLAVIAPDLPLALSGLITRLLSKNPDDRPATATDVVVSLEFIAEDLPKSSESRKARASELNTTVPTSVPQVVPPPKFPSGRALAVVGLLLLGLLVITLSSFLRAGKDAEANHFQLNPNARGNDANSSAVQGVSDDEIILGMSGPFSGSSRELGREMELGIRSYFKHVNAGGGIANRKLSLVVLDDGYEPDRALANIKELREERRAFAVIGNVGTPTAEKAVPYALAKKMIYFGAFSGALLLRRDPPDRYVFNYRASYDEETAATVKYLVESKSIRPEQIAVFAQQDGYGDAGFSGVVKALRKYGRKPETILRVGHPRGAIEAKEAVQKILSHQDEIRAVVMVSTYRLAARFIRQIKDAKADMLFANVSFVGSDALAEELHQMGPAYASGVIVTQVVPHPESQATIVLKHRELLKKYYPNERPSFVSLEGHVNAAIFTEGLRRVGKDLDTEKLVDAFERLSDLDLGLGTSLRYSASMHQASHKVWGTILGSDGKYQILDLE